MRPIKDLLILVRDKLPELIEREECICWAAASMYPEVFDYDEATLICDYIDEHRPEHAIGRAFFWPCGELEPRIEFLNKLIGEA
jgi:hypothetical protein